VGDILIRGENVEEDSPAREVDEADEARAEDDEPTKLYSRAREFVDAGNAERELEEGPNNAEVEEDGVSELKGEALLVCMSGEVDVKVTCPDGAVLLLFRLIPM
jgi:hypothetical protein